MTGQQLTFDAAPDEMILFLSEAEEQLELLGQDILRLETEGDTNSELLQEIFRAAHTLKGSSGAIGHQRMARLTHALESVLDQVRHHRLPISTELIDLLLKGLDALRVLLEEVSTYIESDIVIDDLVGALVALAQGTPTAVPATPAVSVAVVVAPTQPAAEVAAESPTQPAVASTTDADDQTCWHLVAVVDAHCLLPAARSLQIVMASELFGTVVASTPSRTAIEAIEVAIGTQVLVTIAAEAGDDIDKALREAIDRIPEIALISLTAPIAAASESSVADVTPSSVPTGDEIIWHLAATIDKDCFLPSVRALQVAMACKLLGTITEITPSLESIEACQVDLGAEMTISFATNDATLTEEALRKALDRVAEVTITQIVAPSGTITGASSAHEQARQESLPTAKIDAAELAAVFAMFPEMPMTEPTSEMTEAVHTESVATETAHVPSVVTEAAHVPNPATEATHVESVATETPLTPVVPATPIASVVPIAPTTLVAQAAKPAEHPEVAPRQAPPHTPRMVRIDVERLDALMNLVGELVIDRTRLARISRRIATHIADQAIVEELTETCRHLARISDDLQDEVMRSRMLPIESVFSKFPRLVRDLAQRVNKKVDFIVEGKDTELDRSVAEQISDPIIHLLRNSIDHGIESEEDRRRVGKPDAGQVRLSARHEENQIVIDIEDDGKGISADFLRGKAASRGLMSSEVAARLSDREALELIFASGFSTAEQVSDISGRGVGMDIVRTNVERLNGTITLETEVGQGTRFTVRLPLTLAIIRALLIEVAGQTYAMPLSSVVEALRIEKKQLRYVNGHEAIELRGQVLPLLRLSQVFHDMDGGQRPMPSHDTNVDQHFVVAVRWGDRRSGLIVDSLIGEQEIVIKSLGHLFRASHGISGGAVLGDGQVAPILDISALMKRISVEDHSLALAQGAWK